MLLPLLLPLLPALVPPAAAGPPGLALPEGPDYKISVLSLTDCEGFEGQLNKIVDATFRRINKTTAALSATVCIGKTIEEGQGWWGTMEIFRQNGEDAQSRTQVAKINVPDLCEAIKGPDYQGMADKMEGDVSRACPLKEGTVNLVNYIVDLGTFRGKLQEGRYRFINTEYLQKNVIGCYDWMVDVAVTM